MSVKVMAIVWQWSLSAPEKLVALKLADCANDAGANAYPALATVADACGLSRRGTQKVIDRLLEKGCVEVQEDHTNRRSTVYRLCLGAQPGGEQRSSLEANHVHLHAQSGGERSSSLEANDVHPTSTPGGEPGSPLEANGVPAGGEPGSPLEANDVHPIRHTTVSDPSCTRQRARARRFSGRRLSVSEAQHQVVVDELGDAAGWFDWDACYAAWDARLVASGEDFDTLEFIKRMARHRVEARKRSTPPTYLRDRKLG